MAGIAICITIFIFVTGFAGMHVFITTFNQTMKDTMSREAENYRGRIQRQVENNFQTLNTLASFIEMAEFDKKEEFETALVKADEQNDFLFFGYFNLEGDGIFTSDRGRISVSLSNVSEEIRHVVETTFQGEKAVSDAFMGDVSMQSVFVYGVPVYQDGKVTGSLVASDSVDAFSEEVGNKEVRHRRNSQPQAWSGYFGNEEAPPSRMHNRNRFPSLIQASGQSREDNLPAHWRQGHHRKRCS